MYFLLGIFLGLLQTPLRAGSCDENDPSVLDPVAPTENVFCPDGEISVDSFADLGRFKHYQTSLSAQVRGSYFLNDWWSVHADVQGQRDFFGKERHVEQDFLVNDASLQLGNASVHRLRTSVGFIPPAFGVNDSPMGLFYEAMEDQDYWPNPGAGALLTLDNQADTLVQASVSQGSDEEKMIGAVRGAYDIAALDGTRFLLSAATDRTPLRRVGFAMLNVNERREKFQVEYVRRFFMPEFTDRAMKQLFRLGYQSAVMDRGQWTAQYDDDRFSHRFGLVGYQWFLFDHLGLRLYLGYRKSEKEGVKSAWLMGTGIAAQL